MIIHDFDIDTEPIVNLEHFYGEKKHLVDKCLILVSKVIHDYLLRSYDCEKIGEIAACNGNIGIYCFSHEGERIAFYLSGVGSAVARYRKVTTWPLVQVASGPNVVLLRPLVTPSSTAQTTAFM